MRLGIGLGIGRSGGTVLQGGTLAAVSGPATFEAVGGTWTWGALDTDAWLRADFPASITVGAEATLAAVSTWDTFSVTRSTDGDWLKIADNANPNPYEHFVAKAPGACVDGLMGFDLKLRRGAPPPGETDNVIRIWGPYGACYADVNLDDGSVVAGTYDYCDVDPLGDTADAGYRVQVGFGTYYGASGEPCRVGLLVSGSPTYTDATGEGFFRIKDAADAWQQRVERWTDMRIGGYFEQTTEAEQPILWRDSRGACLVFTGRQTMAGHDWITLPNGTAAPVGIAIACECALTDRVPLAWRTASSGEVIELLQQHHVALISNHRSQVDGFAIYCALHDQQLPHPFAFGGINASLVIRKA